MTDTRRDFFGKVAAAFVVLKTEKGDVQAVVDAEPLELVDVPSGQIIDDIIIGTFGIPADAHYMIDFYRASEPTISVLSVPLNVRATFRWVAAPNREIRLKRGDRLIWRIAYSDDAPRSWQVAVYTKGECSESGRQVANQSQFV